MVFAGELRGGAVNGFGRLRQFLVAEGDGLVEHRTHHVVARFGQVGIEIHLGLDLAGERVGKSGGSPGVDAGQHRQAADLRIEQQLLALGRERVIDEFLRVLRVLRAGDHADVGGHDGGHRGIDELGGEARGLGGEAEEVDHQTDAILAAVDAVGHAEAALGDGGAVARDHQQLAPALFPAFALKNGLHRQVGRARARRRRHGDVAEIDRFGQIGPFFRRRQLVRLHVTRVPHDAVAGERLAEVIALGVVDRIGADLGRHFLRRRLELHQQFLRGQHLERVRRRDPEHVRLVIGRRFADVGDASGRRLVEYLDLDAGVLRLERLLVGAGQLLRKRSHDHHLLLRRRRSGEGQGERRAAQAQEVWN